jgi:hypothetical protein
MNRYLLTAIVVSLISCKNTAVKEEKVANSIRREVVLDDSLGIVTFDSPIRYDTTFSWIHISDCTPCHYHKYRVQSKSYPIIKESGWMWEHARDSIDRFTITHSNLYFPTYGSDSIRDIVSHKHFKEKLLSDERNLKITFDTLYKINDRDFSVVVMEKEDSIHYQSVFASTSINNNEVKFSYELITGKQDSKNHDFVKNAIAQINSIRILNGRPYNRERVGKTPY